MKPLALLLAAALMGACGSDPRAPATAAREETTPSPLATVAEAAATFALYVSNQSFEDPTVGIEVQVDGGRAVADDFEVGNQHVWVTFGFRLEPGPHDLVATSSTGARLDETFRVPRTGTRYAVLSYWSESGPHFTWNPSDTPPAFD